jgi:hypothetical protein
MTGERYRDWEARLLAWHREWLRRPHVWDASDCGCMAAAEIMAISDIPDPMAELRGHYHDAESNARLLHDLGFATPGDFVASKLDEWASPALARRGDIGVAGIKHSPLVVVMGHSLVGIGPRGLESLPRAQLTRAFKVG